MNVKEKWQQFKQLFDWTPIAVSGPCEVHHLYGKDNPVLVGYRVAVNYKHHGDKEYFFAHDEEKIGIMPRAKAYKRALVFYAKMQKQMKQH